MHWGCSMSTWPFFPLMYCFVFAVGFSTYFDDITVTILLSFHLTKAILAISSITTSADDIVLNCTISSVRKFSIKDDGGSCGSNAGIGRFYSKSSITGKSECFHLLICLTFDFFFFFFSSGAKSWLPFVCFVHHRFLSLL